MITVHMHLVISRSFSVTHHTVIFAVLNENWELDMEVQLKMDFGAAIGTLKDKSNTPRDAEKQQKFEDLYATGKKGPAMLQYSQY